MGDRRAGGRGRWRGLLRGAGRLVAFWIAGSVLSVILLRFIPPITTAFQTRDRAERLLSGRSPVLAYTWAPYGAISDRVKLAVIAAEDQKFATHYGFDLESMADAIERHERRGRRLRGASTITQQVAKNLFLWRERSWPRKAFEAYYTALLELAWPKERILEVYLNAVELGDGVYGVRAASLTFFDREPARLSAYQASLLASVLPRPRRFSARRPSPYVERRAAWVQGQVWALGGASYLRQFEGRWF